MRMPRGLRFVGFLLVFANLFLAGPTKGGDAQWLASPATGIWNTASNWTPATVPNGFADTATFFISSMTTVSVNSPVIVSGITFNAGASAYNITPQFGLSLTFTGAGVVNNSGVMQNFTPLVVDNTALYAANQLLFTNSASAGSLVTYTLNGASNVTSFFGATALFANTSSAGSATFILNGGSGPGTPNTQSTTGSSLGFIDSATAANATFVVNPGTADTAAGGNLYFNNLSDPANAHITNNGATVSGAFGGTSSFDGIGAGSAVVTNNGASGGAGGGFTQIAFGATGANATFINNGGTISGAKGGTVNVLGFSDLGLGTVTNNGGMASGASGGIVKIMPDGSAGSATITNNSAPVDGAQGGQLQFTGIAFGLSTGGTAQIINQGAVTSNAGPGMTTFTDLTTAGNATIVNNGASLLGVGGAGGETLFQATATAANATITNNGALIVGGLGGTTQFFDTSTAATATLTNSAATVLGGSGQTIFHNSSSAGSSTITSKGASLASGGTLGGVTQFTDTATAGTATLIAQGGTAGGDGGVIAFLGSSTASTARIEVFGNGNLDISSHASPGLSINTLEGDGIVFLGSRTLTIGTSGGSSTFSGTIEDGGMGGGTAGQVKKLGTGTITLTGNSTYTGITTVAVGTLLVDGSIGSAVSGVSVIGGILGGTGTVHGGASIGNAGTFAPGDLGGPGTLTLDSLTFANLSNLNYRLNTPGVVGSNVNDLAVVNGFLGIDGVLNIAPLSGFGIGTYRLFNYSGSLFDGGITMGNIPMGYTFAIDKTVAHQINLNVTSNGQVIFWNGANTVANNVVNGGNGTWNGATNWTDAAGANAGAFNNSTGVFAGTAGTVVLGASITFGTLEFRTTGYQVNPDAGNTFSLVTPSSNTSIIVDTAATATINAPISGSGGAIIKNGPGTLILNGVNTYGQGIVNNTIIINTTINAGTLQLGDATHVAALKGGIYNNAVLNIVNADTTVLNGIWSFAGATSTFFGGSSSSAVQITNIGAAAVGAAPGTTIFADNSNAGTSLISNYQSINGGPGGLLVFKDNASAGSAHLQSSTGMPNSASNPEIHFLDHSTAGNANILNSDGNSNNVGYTRFYNNSTAGNATIQNQGSGYTVFYDSSTAGNATIRSINNAFQDATLDGGTQFRNNSNAGTAMLNNGGSEVTLGSAYNGLLDFYDNSSAAHATVHSSAFGTVTFHDHSTAGNMLYNTDPVGINFLIFTDHSTAENATLNNHADSNEIFFDGYSTAANATINNNFSSYVEFTDHSSAGNATINNTAFPGYFSGGNISFQAFSTAGNATIYNDSPEGVFFNSTVGDATVYNLTNGVVDFSQEYQAEVGHFLVHNYSGATVQMLGQGLFVNGTIINDTGATLDISSAYFADFFPVVTLGSVSGGGAIILGTRTLAVGTLNQNDAISGNITGTGPNAGFTKLGTGTLTLSGVNSYQGLTTVETGTLKVGSSTALPSVSGLSLYREGTLDMNGFNASVGSLADGVTGGGTITNSSNTPVTLTTGGDNTSTAFSGKLTNGAATLALVKSGTGTQILSGTNTYTGTTQVTAGTLQVDGSLGNTITTVASGGTLGGVGSIGAQVTVQNGGTFAPGDSPGTMTVASMILNSGSILNYQLGTPGVVGSGVNDLTIVNGNLTLDGVLNIASVGGFGAGTYRLFNYTGTLTNNALSFGTLPIGFTVADLMIQTSIANEINLIVGGVPPQYWDGPNTVANNAVDGGTSTWNNATTNWTNAAGSANSNWQQGVAIFSAGSGTVSLGANISATELVFQAGSGAYTIVAGSNTTLTINGNGVTNSSASIQNFSVGASGSQFGSIIFNNSATAGTSNVAYSLAGGTTPGNFGGRVAFNNNSTAGSAAFTLHGGGFIALGGRIDFNNSATAGNGTFTVEGGTADSGSGGFMFFNNNSTAANGQFTLAGGSVAFAQGAEIDFKDSATAASALLTANGAALANTFGSFVTFNDTSTAGGATLIANGGSNGGTGGEITFLGDSTGGTATVKVFGNGEMDISAHHLGVTVGSIEGDGNIFLGGNNLTTGANNGSTTFSGVLQDDGFAGGAGGSLTKIGTGKLILSGTNTYTGPTHVNVGTLQVDGTLANTTTTVASGATLGGVGSIGGPVTVQNGGILAPGDSPGTITVASLILNSGSILNYQLGVPGVVGSGVNDLTIVNGNLMLDGVLNIASLGGFGVGTYRLFDYTGSLTDNVLGFGTLPVGFTSADLVIQTSVANEINLIVGGGVPLQYWDGPNTVANNVVDGGTSIWNNVTTNWTNAAGSANTKWQQGVANFSAGSGTVSLGANITATELVFQSGSGVYTINTGTNTLTITGAGVTNDSGVAQHFIVDVSGASGGQIIFNGAAVAGDSLTDYTTNGNPTLNGTGGQVIFNGTSRAGTATFTNGSGGAGANAFGSTFFHDNSSADHGTFHNNAGAATGGTTEFFDLATAGSATITNNASTINGQEGKTLFHGSSSAGSAMITNIGTALNTGNRGGGTVFLDTSLAGTATITINGAGGGASAQGGYLEFHNSASADHATIMANGATANNAGSGQATFFDTSTAGSGTFTTNGGTISGAFGGITRFANDSTAGSGVFTNNGAAVSGAGGGETRFFDNATAGNGAFTNHGGTVSGASGGLTKFFGSTTAGSGVFTNNGGGVSGASGGSTQFFDSSSAGSATFTNNGASVSGAGSGNTQFFDTSTAGSATLIANLGTGGGQGGLIAFLGDSTGGTARIIVGGNGSLDISPHNAPGVTIGSVEGNGNVFLGSRTLTVGSNNANTTFSGVMADGGESGGTGGSLTKIGIGTLTLAGINTYTGNTNINGGTLFVDGSIASANTYVNAGGTLGGNGTIFGNVFNSGVVSPGHSPGILHITGNYTQTSGGTLVIEVASSTSFDKLNIDGHASLGGTLRVVQLNGYQPKLGDKLIFLTAGGGVSGTFSTTHNDFLGTLVRLDVVYEANDVALVGTQNSFTNAFGITTKKAKKGQPVPQPTSILGITPNQIAVALALDSALFDSRQGKVLAFLDGIDFNTVPHQLDKIAPEELTAIYTLGFAQLDAEVLSLQQRLMDIRIASRTEHPAPPTEEVRRAKTVDKEPVSTGLPEEEHYGFFLTETGDFASAGDTYNANGFNIKSAGTTLGVDVRLSEHFVLGLMLEYERSDSDLIDGGHLRVDGGKAALYAMYHNGGFFTEGLVGGGYNSYDTSRSALQGIAHGRTDGGQLDTYLGMGFDKPVGPVVITPIASLLYSVVGIQGFDEFGSLEPLHINSQNESSMRGRVGVRVSHSSQFHAATLTSSFSAQWQHEFLNDDLALESSFGNGAGAPFVVHGPRIGRDSALLTGAFNVQWSAYAAYVAYQADLGRKNYENQTVLVGFRVSW